MIIKWEKTINSAWENRDLLRDSQTVKPIEA